jgi:peptidoglycan/LPS O-acetylase OafA/YrhL
MSVVTIADSAATHGSSELERVGYLDGWRGLAIALVLQHHFFEIEWANFGRLGVDIFFCLSGLLMSRILFIKRTPLTIFYKRRISRILPSFFLYVIAVHGFAYFQGKGLGWIDFTSTLSFLRSYIPASPRLFDTGYPLAHLWSLNVEEHSYILLSLLTLFPFLKKREGIALITLGCLSITIFLLYAFVPATTPKGIPWIKTEAAMSCLVISAGYSLLSERIAPFVKPWMPIATLLLSLLLYVKLFSSIWWVYQAIITPFLLAFSVNHLVQTPRFFRTILASTPLRLLGISSYSIYLWQQPVYEHYVDFYLHKGAFNFGFLLMALAVGGVMFHWFENPSRTYLNKVW